MNTPPRCYVLRRVYSKYVTDEFSLCYSYATNLEFNYEPLAVWEIDPQLKQTSKTGGVFFQSIKLKIVLPLYF